MLESNRTLPGLSRRDSASSLSYSSANRIEPIYRVRPLPRKRSLFLPLFGIAFIAFLAFLFLL